MAGNWLPADGGPLTVSDSTLQNSSTGGTFWQIIAFVGVLTMTSTQASWSAARSVIAKRQRVPMPELHNAYRKQGALSYGAGHFTGRCGARHGEPVPLSSPIDHGRRTR